VAGVPDLNSTDSAEPGVESTAEPIETAAAPELPPLPEHFGRDVALYSLARLGIVVVIAAVLALANVPLVLGAAVGLIVGFPLAMVTMRPWHNRVSAGMAARSAHRNAQRAALRAELRGDEDDAVVHTVADEGEDAAR
jgi:hypothetical protein